LCRELLNSLEQMPERQASPPAAMPRV
jgi:hypothetical protein